MLCACNVRGPIHQGYDVQLMTCEICSGVEQFPQFALIVLYIKIQTLKLCSLFCYRYLAMVLYHAGDTAGAIVQQHRELIINERCLGLDHPDTAHRHVLLFLFFSILLLLDFNYCLSISHELDVVFGKLAANTKSNHLY